MFLSVITINVTEIFKFLTTLILAQGYFRMFSILTCPANTKHTNYNAFLATKLGRKSS